MYLENKKGEREKYKFQVNWQKSLLNKTHFSKKL